MSNKRMGSLEQRVSNLEGKVNVLIILNLSTMAMIAMKLLMT